jgi:hypothetical protein
MFSGADPAGKDGSVPGVVISFLTYAFPEIMVADHTKIKYNIKMLYAHIPARKCFVRMENRATK